MADIDDSSLLGDMLSAASRQASKPVSPAHVPRARIDLEDLIRLSDKDWLTFLGAAAPDDLVVICASIAPEWRNRIFSNLDDVSADWMRSNIAALDDVGPALRQESRDRLMTTARRLQREGLLTLPQPADSQPEKHASPPAPKADAATPPFVSIDFDAAPPPPRPQPTSPQPVGITVHVGTSHTGTPAAAAEHDGLEALFADLKRLRAQAGLAALGPLAADISDPFLSIGLSLVASGLPGKDLERALDAELARQAVAQLDRMALMRSRLIDIAQNP